MSSANIPIANHLVLYDVSWSTYTGMIDALGDKRLPHVYQRGTLEMMSPTEEHESIKRFMGRLVEAASLELRVAIRSVGSATRQNQRLAHGVEPDESYYIGRHAAAGARRGTAGRKAVPDLVIEIEWSRAVLSKLDSYAVLGVREVWRYYRGKVEFFQLDSQHQYERVDHSRAFEVVKSSDVSKFVSRLEKSDENSLIIEFVELLRRRMKSR